ncbi:cadherin-24, partial [Pelodiscus sinensis]|uniref:cadherin-24 n=1 Tax=Pelodiscus sinensis TaxID=13735 RepID=UPI003F6CF513
MRTGARGGCGTGWRARAPGRSSCVDERTGDVHLTRALDREEKAEYRLLGQALDGASRRPLEPPSEFLVQVQDVNDNPPVFPHGAYHATVPRAQPRGNLGDPGDGPRQTDDPSYGSSARLVYTVLEGLPFF